MDKRDVIDMPSHVWQHRSDMLPAFSASKEWPRAFHQVAILPLKREKVFFTGQRLAVILLQRRLVFPKVQMRSRTRAENLQDAFRFCGMMRLTSSRLPCALLSRRRSGQQVHQSDTAKTSMDIAQESTAGEIVELVHRFFFSRHRRPAFIASHFGLSPDVPFMQLQRFTLTCDRGERLSPCGSRLPTIPMTVSVGKLL